MPEITSATGFLSILFSLTYYPILFLEKLGRGLMKGTQETGRCSVSLKGAAVPTGSGCPARAGCVLGPHGTDRGTSLADL